MRLRRAISAISPPGRLPLIGLVLVLPLAFVALSQCRSEPTQPPGPDGYGMLEFAANERSAILDDPQALGINVLINWSQLEPEEGVYDWSELDAALEAAEARGKRVAPRIYTNASDFGNATPNWVFDAGAEAFFPDDWAEVHQPVPYDPVFTEKFGTFLRALGERYNGHPAIEFFQTNAGMGTFGEMVWGVPEHNKPNEWTPEVQIETSEYWIDAWRDAFPDTPLVLMQNHVGFGIVEDVAEYAVDRGFYLQANTPYLPDEAQDIMREYDNQTKIVMEVEDAGCQTALGDAFDEMIDEVFAADFAIDYLVICHETFVEEPERVGRALDLLRRP